ncbi:ABC-F family ATP-binding cassette domain-containing protein [Clostridiaceae bacterium Marseille-Q4143]|nr:ABC-F family ATP-binding cassette domain-containing protein [Candidatus Choladocola sp.]QUO22787.1 ABC-F family ATP-binding cassette domain-containing protein [Clostridiaceae bacterium Marseille-Q4143]
MNILNIEHVSKLYGDKWIFDDISCGIQEGEKIGIIGINGTGKTTLLRIIAGTEEPDQGQVVRQNGAKLAYLTQMHEFPEEETVLSYVVSGSASVKGNWGGTDAGDADIMEHEARSMLNTLGILEHDAKMGTLSGGQKKRAALARTLLLPSDILILDEPTNHLDEDMIRWLEQYLRRYRGTVITVTHDRYFLDQVTNRILEISRGKIYSYDANYSKFLELKAQREEMELATERKRQSILRMELEWAARGCRARTTKQRARLDRLEALKAGKAPVFDKALELDSVETRMGKKTIELHHVSKSYEGRKIVEDFDYIFLKNQTVAFVGSNGCGKSTLLKMIAGQIPPDEGSVEFGETIKMGYFAQEIPQMDENQRVIDYVKDIAEYIPTRDGRITASQMLERFLFTPDMQYAPIGKLSGGEKRRLYLLGVLQQGPNVLVMDEVTNELDIPTLTILEDYLNSFIGIVILVSHDRYFLDNVSDRIFAFDGCGHFRQYEGGYTDYLESKNRENGGIAEKSSSKASAEVSGGKKKATWDKGEKKLKFSYKEQKEFETIDDDIAALEQKIEELDAEMAAHASQYSRLSELTEEKEKVQAELDEKMERWMYLTELNEKIEAQK